MTNEEIVQQIQQGNDPTGHMEQLYKQNYGMMYKVALKYSGRADIDDLMQEAYFGLYEAAKKYEGDQETKFSTYALYWIRQAITRYIDNTYYTVRASVGMQQLYYKYMKLCNAYMLRYNRYPTDQEAKINMGVKLATIQNMKKAMYSIDKMDSIDRSVGGEDDNLLVGDSLIGSNDIAEGIVDKMIEEDKKTALWGIVANYTSEIESKVIVNRYKQDMTLEAIGKEMGLSRDRVRQVESTAMRKLKLPRVKRLLADRFDIAITCAYKGSVGRFRSTWTSSTERAAMKLYDM